MDIKIIGKPASLTPEPYYFEAAYLVEGRNFGDAVDEFIHKTGFRHTL